MPTDPILQIVFAAPPTKVPPTSIGETVNVSGAANIVGGVLSTAGSAKVQFGAGSLPVPATIVANNSTQIQWRCTGTVPATALNGAPLDITVTAEAGYVGTPSSETGTAYGTGKVTVVLNSPAPALPTITFDPPGINVAPTTFPYLLTARGTATCSPYSRITSVQYVLQNVHGTDAPVSVDNGPGGDWKTWSKGIPLSAGEYKLKFVVTDTHHTTAESQLYDVLVSEPFEGGDPNQVFASTTYLSELLGFAQRWIVTGTATAVTSDLLDSQFSQPFKQLVVSDVFNEATAPIHQSRIAIEVLRKQSVPALPADAEQRFRTMAYQALLRQLGTSYEELRLARVANAAARASLAARIGIDLSATPDALDQITLLPVNTTDTALEQLFGYRSTNPSDPLATMPQNAAVLTWMQSATRNAWMREDVATRASAKGFLPVVDPDLLTGDNFVMQKPDDPAYSLWKSRQVVVADRLSEISQYDASDTSLSNRFNSLISKYVGAIDLAGLSAQDADGVDVTSQLLPFNLALDGFRFLALCSQLLASSVLLDSEWDDVYAILLQSQKEEMFTTWRSEEIAHNIVLEPAAFLPNTDAPAEIPRWRGDSQTLLRWQRTLIGRTAQAKSVASSYAQAVDSAESQTLPGLRDALLQWTGANLTPPLAPADAAEQLSRALLIDLLSKSNTKTTRVDQAIETLQGVIFSVRSERLKGTGDESWTLVKSATPTPDNPAPPVFDNEWVWMGSYRTWLAAIKVFAYPENQLAPNLYVTEGPLAPTQAFIEGQTSLPAQTGLLTRLRLASRVTPDIARKIANDYLGNITSDAPGAAAVAAVNVEIIAATEVVKKRLGVAIFADPFSMHEDRSDTELLVLQIAVQSLFNSADPSAASQYVREIFWLAPMAIALRLQEDREYVAALDWFRTVYAYNLPLASRKIYYGLTLEESLSPSYGRVPEWLSNELNPHVIVRTSTSTSGLVGRKDAYTIFTVMSIVKCFLAYGDLQFSKNLAESTAEARTLYNAAIDLLAVIVPPDPQPGAAPAPFPPNPLLQSLVLQAQSSLAKIHNGMNIAGIRIDGLLDSGAATMFLPSQYRYAFLIDRAKNLVGISQQIEASYLAALEKRDAETYSILQANNDIKVAASSITLANLKVADSNISAEEAQLQKYKAVTQYDHYDTLISNGRNFFEWAQLDALGTQLAVQTTAVFLGGDLFGSAAGAASTSAQIFGLQASYERNEEEWHFQKNLSEIDGRIADQQIAHAQNQQSVAFAEVQLADLQLSHATEVLDFLSNKFTSAELFQWMSGVLGNVYAYFLQQATSIAQLAEAQLAFERQAPAAGFIQSDYWQDASDNTNVVSTNSPDRQGMTGSARLLQDIYQLDEYAVETDSRKLHITQTVIASQVAALELQQFRDTGVLILPTPMTLFDQDFPGHYLRLVKSVAVSINALVPVRGVRATLSASGLSRVIVPGDEFTSITLSRSPEAISFTSPVNATGLFDMEAETGLLLPFEGMGVDAVWQLELPKPANPFDYRTISDVQLTIKYTAMNSYDYRQEVLRNQLGAFSGDRSFSIRNDFPDVWYELNNPETVADVASQMKASLETQPSDFPPHLDDLAVQQVTLFCLRQDGFTEEITIVSLDLSISGQPSTVSGSVQTTGGIVGTRRPGGAAWQSFVGQSPVGAWSIQFENSDAVRALFKDGSLLDVVLVLTVTATPPAWPL